MLLSNKSGIACDLCKSEHTKEFIYYSYDVTAGRVIDNQLIQYHGRCGSLDVCGSCFTTQTAAILKFYKTPVIKNGKYSSGLVCELSGEIMRGTFDLCKIDVTKVWVDITKPERTTAKTEQFLEIIVSQDTYKKLKNDPNNV